MAPALYGACSLVSASGNGNCRRLPRSLARHISLRLRIGLSASVLAIEEEGMTPETGDSITITGLGGDMDMARTDESIGPHLTHPIRGRPAGQRQRGKRRPRRSPTLGRLQEPDGAGLLLCARVS